MSYWTKKMFRKINEVLFRNERMCATRFSTSGVAFLRMTDMRFSLSHYNRSAIQFPGVCGFIVTDMSGNRDLITLLAYLLCTVRLQFMLYAFLRRWMTWTRQIIQYRETATLLRPQIKQYIALNEGRIQNQRNIISFWQWRNVCILNNMMT